MQITFDHTDLANPACRRILAALLDRDEPQQLVLDLGPAEPPPVPTAPAPTAPDGTDAPTEPPPAPVFDLDADGTVWDARLHSSSRTKTADGRWKKRRGSADLPPPAPAPAATLAPAPAATPAPAEPVIPWGDAPAAPPAALAATPAPAPADPEPLRALLQHVAKLQAAKLLPMSQLFEVINGHGIPTLIELSKRPDAIPAVMADLPSLPEVQS